MFKVSGCALIKIMIHIITVRISINIHIRFSYYTNVKNNLTRWQEIKVMQHIILQSGRTKINIHNNNMHYSTIHVCFAPCLYIIY